MLIIRAREVAWLCIQYVAPRVCEIGRNLTLTMLNLALLVPLLLVEALAHGAFCRDFSHSLSFMSGMKVLR